MIHREKRISGDGRAPESIDDHAWYSLQEAARTLRVSAETLRRQARRGAFEVRHQNRRIYLEGRTIRDLAAKNHSRILGWNRLVDVCKELGLHRNVGESVCRKVAGELALDLCGHYRISPAAERHLRERARQWREKEHWTRKTRFAREVGEDPRLVDVVVRKLGLPMDKDAGGFAILSPEACEGFLRWRDLRDAKRRPVYQFEGREYHPADSVAAAAAASMAPRGTPAYAHMCERYYRRILFWISSGSLPGRKVMGKLCLTSMDRERILDDLPLGEAARFGNVSVSTVKQWIASGDLEARRDLGTRRSVSRETFRHFLRHRYETSPKLNKRPEVPLWILGKLEEITALLNLPDAETLGRAVCDIGNSSSAAMRPFLEGRGSIPRPLFNLVNHWVSIAGEGLHVDALTAYQTVGLDKVKHLMQQAANLPEGPSGDQLRGWVSHLAKISPEKLARVLQSPEDVPLPMIVERFLLAVLAQGKVEAYDPSRGYEKGSLLLHIEGADFGTVEALEENGLIIVDWYLAGQLKMRHHPILAATD